MKIIKSHAIFVEHCKVRHVPYDATLAVAEILAFHAKASVVIPRVGDRHAMAVIRETLRQLLELTGEQKPVVKLAVSL